MLVNHGTKWAMASIANCNKHPEGTIQYIHAYHSLTHCHAILFPLIFHKHVQVFKYYIINKSWRYILLIFPLISSIIKPLLLFSIPLLCGSPVHAIPVTAVLGVPGPSVAIDPWTFDVASETRFEEPPWDLTKTITDIM